MRLNSFLILASFLPFAAAQSTIATPALGYAFDADLRAIRPVRGIPGAAILGEPLHTRFAPASAAISPAQDYAIALSPEEGPRLISWNGERASVIPLDGAAEGAGRVVFSPAGSAAILYHSNSGRMQAVIGLPDAPVLREIQPAGSPTAGAFAIADDATVALARPDGVVAIGPDLSSSPLPLPGTVAALAFRRATHDLVAVTGSGDLYWAKNVNGNLEVRQVYSGDSQTGSPVAVQFSPDGFAVFAANAAGVIATIDLTTGSIASLSCQCTPTGLQPFGRASLFRITDISDRPLLLFDGTPARNRVWFVPAETRRSAQ